jgi:hypothetical protein
MLPKEERKAWNEAFWAEFKAHMRACLSASGKRVNWASYPTQVKNTYLRMICEGRTASIATTFNSRTQAYKLFSGNNSLN